jgi:N,N'-diacetyllegionaminate synthase
MADLMGPILFLVPARGGSQRVIGKNLRPLAGIPLVGWAARTAIRTARRLPGDGHRVVCSTDDAAIAAVARAWGAETPFVRPASLAGPEATSTDVALHALEALRGTTGESFHALVLVQPTSPLVEPEDLLAAIARFDSGGGRPVVSVTPTHPASWHRDVAAPSATLTNPGAPTAPYVLNGAVYVVAPADLAASRRFDPDGASALVLPSSRAVDIDEEVDLVIAAGLLEHRAIRPVPIGDRILGGGPVFVIAEAGVNHDGDPNVAHALVDEAADAGADCVKFQTFDPSALAAADAPTAEYQRAAGVGDSDQRAMLTRLALPLDAWPALQAHAAERGIVFLSSPFDAPSADLLDRLGVPAFKVASGELTNIPFLVSLAHRGRPLLVSTGMADMLEVAAALDAIADSGDPPVALLHCVSSYPADPTDANLRAIATMRATFGVPVGWSDHTTGLELPLAAVAAGAALIEKHLTLDRTRPGPDHRASLEPAAFRDMVAGIRLVEGAMGSGDKVPAAAERAIAALARKSLHWGGSLPAGAVVADGDVVAMRPGTGLRPARLRSVVGRTTLRAVRAGSPVDEADLEA